MEHLLAKEGVAGSIPVSRFEKAVIPSGIAAFFVPILDSEVPCRRSDPRKA